MANLGNPALQFIYIILFDIHNYLSRTQTNIYSTKDAMKIPDVPEEGTVIKGQQFGTLYGKWIIGCKRGCGQKKQKKLFWCKCNTIVVWARVVFVAVVEKERRGSFERYFGCKINSLC